MKYNSIIFFSHRIQATKYLHPDFECHFLMELLNGNAWPTGTIDENDYSVANQEPAYNKKI